MLHLSAVVVAIHDVLRHLLGGVGLVAPDQGVASQCPTLEGHLRKVRAEGVVLILGPALERMVVALVAVEAHAEEGLRDILRHLAGIAQCPEVIAGGILKGAALGEHEVANHLVVRTVGDQLLLDPSTEHPDALFPEVLGIALEQIGKFVGPESGEGARSDQLVDQGVTLGLRRRGIGEKGADPVRRGRLTGEIEEHTSDKLRIGARGGGIDLHPLELGVDVMIDLAALGHSRKLIPGAVAHDHHFTRRIEPFVADQHRHFAASQRGQRGVLHQRHFLVVARQDGLAGDVARGAVGIGGEDEELLLTTGQVHLDLLRQDSNLLRPRRARLLVLRALGDPLAKHLVIGGARADGLASLVRYFAQRLEQHERFLHLHPVEPAATEVVHQGLIIVLGVVSAERKLEAVLPLRRSMAGALVAPGSRQNGLDVPHKAHGVLDHS